MYTFTLFKHELLRFIYYLPKRHMINTEVRSPVLKNKIGNTNIVPPIIMLSKVNIVWNEVYPCLLMQFSGY